MRRSTLFATVVALIVFAAGAAFAVLQEAPRPHDPQARVAIPYMVFCVGSGWEHVNVSPEIGDRITVNGDAGIVFSVHEEAQEESERDTRTVTIEWVPLPD